MKRLINAVIYMMSLGACTAQAHHSFAIYDIDNSIEVRGIVSGFSYTNPHIVLTLDVLNAEGKTESWRIESMNTHRWERAGHPRDITQVGETVSIRGWPARNGEEEMLLSAIITERGETVILKKVRQKRARQAVPG